MATRRVPRTDETPPDDDEGMTAETAVSVMRSTPSGVQVGLIPTDAAEAETQIEDEESTIAARMRALVAQTGSDRVVVKLFRPSRNGGRGYEWCADYAPQELEERDLELIRSQWGPGAYELRVIGSKGIMTRIQVNIAAPSVIANPQPAAAQSELAQILRAMQEQQAALLQAVTQRPDPRAEMMQTLAMMREMREAFGINSAPVAPVPNQVDMIRGIADAVKSLREVSREVLPSDDDGPPDMMTMLAKGLDTVRELAAKQNAPAALALPAPEVPAAFSEGDPMLQFRSHLLKLATMAGAGKAPADGGEYIYAELPDELLSLFTHAQWFEACCQLAPVLRQHETWARAAHAHALQLFRDAGTLPPAA